MKKIKSLSYLMVGAIAMSGFLFSCESNPEVESQEDILPERFSVEIPQAISESVTSGRINGRKGDDSIRGNDMYRHLRTFIAIGKGSAELVEGIIHGIRKHHIDRVLTLSFTSEDDNRVKNLVVTSDVTFESMQWDYQLTITDADSEGNADGGKALQVLWNKSTPIKGIAIIKPYNCDRPKNQNAPDAIFRIDYSEDGSLGYDAHMEVRIAGLPATIEEPFSVDNIHMFAGKKGDVVDVYGNSNHPNATIFGNEGGMNWAFVASGDQVKDIGVAEVGLPASDLDSDDRTVLLEENSIKNVFENGILAIWPGINPDVLDSYLSEIAAPGYFNNNGFVSGGVSPGEDWDVLAGRLNSLTPYNPKDVGALEISFQ